MENTRRSIRLFFVRYGKLILYILGITIFIILILEVFNNAVIEEEKLENEINLRKEEERLIEKQYEEEENKKLSFITSFIYFCNEGRISEAYDMLSDKCKKEKYKTIEEFEENYVKKVFNIYICDYEVEKKDNIYEVKLIQDILVTGKTNSTKIERYKLEWVLENKIYICN